MPLIFIITCVFTVISNNQSQPDSTDCRKSCVTNCMLYVSYQLLSWYVWMRVYVQKMELPPLIILSSIWQFAAFPYILAVGKATKLYNKNLSFKLALLIPMVSMSTFNSTNLFLFSCFSKLPQIVWE